jgi:hypothetical protein
MYDLRILRHEIARKFSQKAPYSKFLSEFEGAENGVSHCGF